MPLSALRRGLFAAAFAATLAGPAAADIKGFNTAVRAGDYKTAAAEAEGIWKSWNTGDPQTALMAREFGFAAFVSGRNDLALQFGEFLVDQGATLATPDDQPATSAVLRRVAGYKMTGGEPERQALRDALAARSNASGLDMTSVLAWEVLYVADWNQGDWTNVEVDALAAADFFKRAPENLQHRQRKAELTAAAAMFLQGRNRVTKGRNDYYDRMVDVHNAIVGDLNDAKSEGDRRLLWPLKWQAQAWSMAMWSYLTSSYEQVGSNISTKVQERPLAHPVRAQYPEDPASVHLPLCDGRFEGKKLSYPASKAYSGIVGGVIARMEVAANGKVTDVELLAAVPSESFGESVIKTLKTWTFKPDKGADTSKCRLNSRNRMYSVTFRML
ncbi:MAG TPA: TonB family protein [Hyphomonadaceae bacterium]|nr:TonB family protein [Hyphomonadaceae bacterium]